MSNMKKYKIIGIISTVLTVTVAIANIMVLTGLFETTRTIRLYVIYPLLLAMLVGSVLLWIISKQLQKKDR